MNYMAFNGTLKELENHAKWEYNSFFLDTIISSLKFMINEGNSCPKDLTPKKWREVLIEIKEGFELAEKKRNHEKVNKNEEAKIGKSFDLFKEHFFDLWD